MTILTSEQLRDVVVDALEDLKAVDLTVLNVGEKSSVTDYMIIASGNSDRHVNALADNVATAAKKAGIKPLGMEGQAQGEWVLVDLADVVVHVMLPRVRDFYQLEKLWDAGADQASGTQG